MSNPAFVMLNVEVQANRARRAFLRYVFHEVRVPLNTFAMGVELLADEGADEEIVETLRGSCKIMGDTLNDILSLQKIEEGAMKLMYKPFSVREMLQAVFLDLEPMMLDRQVHVSINYKTAIPARLLGDKYRLGHTVRSIVCNAIKFSRKSSIVRVNIKSCPYVALNKTREALIPTWVCSKEHSSSSSSSSEGREGRKRASSPEPSGMNSPNCMNVDNKVIIIISIKDEGEGIDAKDVPNIFTPFLNTRPEEMTTGARGSGISLAICKEIIDRHHGIITCTSVKGLGTKFVMTVPFGVVQWGDTLDQLDNPHSMSTLNASTFSHVQVTGSYVTSRVDEKLLRLDQGDDSTAPSVSSSMSAPTQNKIMSQKANWAVAQKPCMSLSLPSPSENLLTSPFVHNHPSFRPPSQSPRRSHSQRQSGGATWIPVFWAANMCSSRWLL